MEKDNASLPAKPQNGDMGSENQAPASEEKHLLLGKFGSVDALARAYSELEAEFTRRSQKLKALEEEGTPPHGSGNGEPRAQPRGSEELYRAASGDEGVRTRIVNEYLSSLASVPLMTGGVTVAAPPVRPKTIAEAGQLALGYLRKPQS